MPEYLTTREVAELLRLKERKVYDLASSGALACSRATGKLLFPEDGVRAWLAEHLSQGETGAAAVRPNVFLGSHDPLLEWALRQSQCGLATYFDGSSDGLQRFAQHEGVATGLHIKDDDGPGWNLGAVRAACGHQPVVLIEWAKRQRGLILGSDVGKPVEGLEDIAGLRLVPRQASAGAQKLLLDLLEGGTVPVDQIEQAEPARTELDAALAVLEGKADVAFGLASVAAIHRLRFVPVMEERFDLLVDRKAWFDPALQTFWQFCRSGALHVRAAELEGYDVSGQGVILFNGA
ncbi:MAG: helix-turn-helix transcriptional regulator [Alphaproteobacteria bacterium]|nr:helix-turn-helix transcriptional regulator [Alphaproteobacteria bacterium]